MQSKHFKIPKNKEDTLCIYLPWEINWLYVFESKDPATTPPNTVCQI